MLIFLKKNTREVTNFLGPRFERKCIPPKKIKISSKVYIFTLYYWMTRTFLRYFVVNEQNAKPQVSRGGQRCTALQLSATPYSMKKCRNKFSQRIRTEHFIDGLTLRKSRVMFAEVNWKFIIDHNLQVICFNGVHILIKPIAASLPTNDFRWGLLYEAYPSYSSPHLF